MNKSRIQFINLDESTIFGFREPVQNRWLF